jgi:starch synthase
MVSSRPSPPQSPSGSTPTERSVLLVGSECVPFAKTGGLADVLGALPAALARLGWSATVALPRYRGVDAGTCVDRFTLALGGVASEVGIFEAHLDDGLTALLVDCPELYDRESLYGAGGVDFPDNPRRFAVLVRAVLECVARRAKTPSIVHAHDWQAGLVPVYLRTLYARHQSLAKTPSVFTIHNLAYQGVFDRDWLSRIDVPSTMYSTEGMEYWGRISFLKGGIRTADVITTVSRQYAVEITTPEFGFGFDGILRGRSADLVGILNGVDAVAWDPERDPHLPAHFGATDLSGKATVKRVLLERYGLPANQAALERPLIGIISRMVDQKGFDLMARLGDTLAQLDAGFVVLGTGEPRYQDFWTGLAKRYPSRIGARIGFDEPLSHLIEGGSDIFLMPSRFEPCGLNQMYSMRYGTVPVVRAVGGLADTVRDLEAAGDEATGFTFRDCTPEALLRALGRALALYPDRARWRRLQLAGMRQDHSWDTSAREYVRIYEQLLNRTART